MPERPRPLLRCGLCLALAAAAGGCGPGPPGQLRILRGPGQDGRRVVLDQVLVVEFDRPLTGPLRPGAVVLVPEGDEPEPLQCEVSGPQILIHPRLPVQPDLSDGSLRPGRRHRLLLRGVPHLAAITGSEGAALVGDRVLEFETVGAEEEDALAGTGGGALEILAPGGGLGSSPWLAVGPGGQVRIPLTGPVDPRCLLDLHAEQRLPDGTRLPIPLHLAENRREGAVLAAQVQTSSGVSLLELPEGLEGPGGLRLPPAGRWIRLRPVD